MSNPAVLYGSLKSACERGTTTQLALDNALARKRLDAGEHAELSAILQATLNPPAAEDPGPTTTTGASTGADAVGEQSSGQATT